MPAGRAQLPRSDKDTADYRAREQELKRSRGAISCAECRRLKLKCDKTVPCTSCKRRGCASICPNGSLVTGQGTRFVLADTDRLHSKITDMSDRIRQLEDALALSHFHVTREQHPLLRRDLMKIKSIIDLHVAAGGDAVQDPDRPEAEKTSEDADESTTLDIFGTLALHDDGGSTFYGRSAGQESLLLGENDSPESPNHDPSRPSTAVTSAGSPSDLPYTIQEISNAFPDASIRLPQYALEAYLPPWPRASELCAYYLEQAPWFFGAVKPRQLYEELLPLFYPQATSPPHAPLGTPPPAPGPHELALLFAIYCFGSLVDEQLPPAPGNAEADRYYMLTRAALALQPVMDRAPSVSTVQALSLMGIYQGLVANEHSIESTWALMGMASKLAQSIGLHRDCARWKLSPAEVQKRRALFWELFITDCWQSLATGRLPTFSIPFVDCELPQDTDQTMAADGTPQASFPYWKAQFGKLCVSEVVQGILTARAPKYSIIVELDRKVRDLELPRYAIDPPVTGCGLNVTMQHYMPTNYRHLTLLYIHRAFFAQGLCDQPHDPLRSPYAPSILAGYRSACKLLASLGEQFALFPVQIARFWVLWTHAFSATVMLALIPVRAPQSKMAHTALMELERACELFERASVHGGRAVKMLPIVRRHLQKAAHSFHVARTAVARELFGFAPIASARGDEFSVFSGVTNTVAARSSASARTQQQQQQQQQEMVMMHAAGYGSQRGDSPLSGSSIGASPPDLGAPSGSVAHQQQQQQQQQQHQQQQHQQQQMPPPSHISMHGHYPAHESARGHIPPDHQTQTQTQAHVQEQEQMQETWDGAHATLVDQYQAFDGALDAQISSSNGWQLGYSDTSGLGGLGGGEMGGGFEAQEHAGHSYASQQHDVQQHQQQQQHQQHQQQQQHQHHQQQYPQQYNQQQFVQAYIPVSSGVAAPMPPAQAHVPVYVATSSTIPGPPDMPPPAYQPHPPSTSYPVAPQQHPHPATTSDVYAYMGPDGQTVPYPIPDGRPVGYSAERHPAETTYPAPSSMPYPSSYQNVAEHRATNSGGAANPGAPTEPAERMQWSVPHTEVVFARPRTPVARDRTKDRVLRQSGDLSLTEAWSAFMSQMDVPGVGAAPPAARPGREGR